MQIHEITKRHVDEGALGNIASGFVQGLTGVDLPRAQPPVDVSALKTAAASLSSATERIVLTVSQPGQTVDTQYFKTGDVWTNEQGQQITKPESITYLDRLIPTHGKKEIIQPAPQARKVSRQRVPRAKMVKVK